MKTKQYIIGKLAILGLALAIFGSSTQCVQAQGKLQAAVEGGKLALEYGEKLGTLLTGLDRGAPIVIANHTNRRLINLRIYTDSGKVLDLNGNTTIPAQGVGGVTVAKSASALAGAVGLITYQIEGVPNRVLAVYYSIPYNQSGLHKDAKNWFTANIDNSPASAKNYNIKNNSTDAKEAGKGVETWQWTELTDRAGYDAAVAKLPPLQRITGTYPILQKFSKVRWHTKGNMVNAGSSKIYIDLYENPGW